MSLRWFFHVQEDGFSRGRVVSRSLTLSVLSEDAGHDTVLVLLDGVVKVWVSGLAVLAGSELQHHVLPELNFGDALKDVRCELSRPGMAGEVVVLSPKVVVGNLWHVCGFWEQS